MANQESTGFSVPPAAIVNQIQTLLKERYKEGFPIIKEIIQNANDAGATRLDIGVSQGLQDDSLHSHLRQPALFFVNNGTFQDRDAQAIGWFGVDFNAGNSAKIGKFGLGQKSVFHFCESFFYIARSKLSQENTEYHRFLTPWADGQPMKSQDSLAVEQYFQSIGLLAEDIYSEYFILWLPLRSSTQPRSILTTVYNCETIQQCLPKNLDIKIGTLMPLLNKLKKVCYWVPSNQGGLRQEFCVDLTTLDQRFIYPKEEKIAEPNFRNDLAGSTQTLDSSIVYGGFEATLSEDQFQCLLPDQPIRSSDFWTTLRDSEYWPKRSTYDDTGNPKTVPDKAIPHYGVVFSRQSVQDSSGLTIQWAVFLPLAEDNPENAACEQISGDGNWSYILMLHGYFFLDSGRQSIEALKDIYEGQLICEKPDNGNQMVSAWNTILATEGTLTEILPALKKFCQDHILKDIDIQHLCCLLKKSRLFKQELLHNYIYKNGFWIYRMQAEQSSWQLVEPVQRILTVPRSPTWEMFPALTKIARIHCLVLDHYPNLIPRDKPDQWSNQEIIDVLNSLNVQLAFQNEDEFQFLVDWLKSIYSFSKHTPSEVQDCLQNKLRMALVQLEPSSLDSQELLIQQTISLLDESRWFCVDCENSALLQYLNKKSNNILLLSTNIAPLSRQTAVTLSSQDAAELISSLMRYDSDRLLIVPIIRQFVHAVPTQQLSDFRNRVSTVQFILGYNCRTEEKHFYSLNDIAKLQDTTFLDFDSSRAFAQDLQNALQEIDVVLIDQKLAMCVPSLRACNRAACFDVLERKPRLSDNNNRSNLLQRLLP